MVYDWTRLYDLIEMQEERKWREEVEEQFKREPCDFFKQDEVYEQQLKDAGVNEDLIVGFKNAILNREQYIQSLVNTRLISYCINLGRELGEENSEYFNR